MRHSAVYGAQTSSILVCTARLYEAVGRWIEPPDSQSGDRRFESDQPYHGVEHERMSALTFNQVIVGSAPTYATSFRGVKLMRMSRRLLTVRQWVRFRPLPPELTGGRKVMRAAVNRVGAGSSPAPSASFAAGEAGASSPLITGRA